MSDIKRALAEAAQRSNGQSSQLVVGFIERMHENWTADVSYTDPDKGHNVFVEKAPVPNDAGSSIRAAMPKKGDMVVMGFAKDNLAKPYILAIYTVYDLQAYNNYLTIGSFLGGA